MVQGRSRLWPKMLGIFFHAKQNILFTQKLDLTQSRREPNTEKLGNSHNSSEGRGVYWWPSFIMLSAILDFNHYQLTNKFNAYRHYIQFIDMNHKMAPYPYHYNHSSAYFYWAVLYGIRSFHAYFTIFHNVSIQV